MNLLAIETTGPYASVAIFREDGAIRSKTSDRKLSHLQNLLPMTGALLKECALEISDLTHIAASIGPGSFTGIRIGVSTARALSQTLSLPVIAVPTLRSFIWNMPDHDGLFCPIFDARREQVYAGAYYRDGDSCLVAVDEGAYAIGDFLSHVEAFDPGNAKKIVLFGDGLPVYGKEIKEWGIRTRRLSAEGDPLSDLLREAPEDSRYQRASATAAFAGTLLERGETRTFEALCPVYIRKAEAERKLEERLAKEKE